MKESEVQQHEDELSKEEANKKVEEYWK